MKNGFQWFSKFAFNYNLRHYNMSDEDLVFVNLKPQPASGGAGDGPLEDMSRGRGPNRTRRILYLRIRAVGRIESNVVNRLLYSD